MAEPELHGVVLNQEYRVKLGKSFTFPRENAFHTIKYDFKPLSVDHSKPGKLRVGEGEEVNMSLPVVQAESADDVAQFRGPKRPCTRECVLIINTETGEAILEKISSSVSLKSVRDSRNKLPRDRSISPSPFATKNQTAGKLVQSGKPAAQDRLKPHKLHPKSRTKANKTVEPITTTSAASISSASSAASLKPSVAASGAPRARKGVKLEPKVAPNPVISGAETLSAPSAVSAMTTKINQSSTAPLGSNDSIFFQQQLTQNLETVHSRQKLEAASSASSSGSSSSSSSGTSESESEEEPMSLLSNAGSVSSTVSQAPVHPQAVPGQYTSFPPVSSASMPILGGGGAGGGSSGGVHTNTFPRNLALPPPPVQRRRSISSSGSESESSSGSSSSGSSSDSSEQQQLLPRGPPTSSVHPQQPSYSSLGDELSCSSDSD